LDNIKSRIAALSELYDCVERTAKQFNDVKSKRNFMLIMQILDSEIERLEIETSYEAGIDIKADGDSNAENSGDINIK
jgi:hypothetical protein